MVDQMMRSHTLEREATTCFGLTFRLLRQFHQLSRQLHQLLTPSVFDALNTMLLLYVSNYLGDSCSRHPVDLIMIIDSGLLKRHGGQSDAATTYF